jgi:hypothetical protein
MIVISKVSNKRLIKGHRYEVQNIWNSGKNQRWLEGKVQLVGFGRYSVNSFTDTNGSPIANIDYSSNIPIADRFIKFEDCVEGEILICTTDHYKTIAKGSMYKIQNLKRTEVVLTGFNGRKWIHREDQIKFEGISRFFKFNGWGFRKLTSSEAREISLGSLLNGEEPNIVKTTNIRGIDVSSNKHKTLMESLSKTILDVNRHHLSIIDWTCQKTAEKLRLKPEDFEDLLNMTLGEILEKIENNEF